MKIDARGLSCPQPVILVKKAADKKNNLIEVLVDDRAAFENVQRYAKSMKFDVKIEEKSNNEHLIILSREG